MTHVHNNLHILEQLGESETGELTYKGVQVRTIIPSGGIVGPKGETGQMGPPAVVAFDGEFPNDGIFDGLICYRRDRFMLYYYTGYPELGESGWLPLSVQVAGSSFPTSGNFVGRLFWHTETRQMYIYSGYPHIGELGWVLFGASVGLELEDIKHFYLIGSTYNPTATYYAKISLLTDTMSQLNFTLTQMALLNLTTMNGYNFSYQIRGLYYSVGYSYFYKNLIKINNSTDAITTGASYNFGNDSIYGTPVTGNNSNHSFILNQITSNINRDRILSVHRFTYLNDTLMNMNKFYRPEGANSKHCYTTTNIYLFGGIYQNPANSADRAYYNSIIKYNMDTNNITMISATIPASQFIIDPTLQGVTVKKTTGAYVIAGNLSAVRFFEFSTEAMFPKTITFPISYLAGQHSGQNLVKGVIYQYNVTGNTAYINFSLTTETATLSSMMHTVPVNHDGRGVAQRSVF